MAALAAAWALTAILASAAWADAAQVTVVSPGGAEQTLSLDALAGQEDIRERSYALRSAAGESTQTVTGFSLAAVLEAAGADPYGFSYLEVQRPAGGAVLLSRNQALDSGGDGPPLVYAAPGGTGFLRPSSGPGDANAADSFVAPQGIALVLRKGSPLEVRATASPLRTRPGQTVTFTAIVERAGSGERLSYSWYFDDGHSASGATARHSFERRGSYDVVVGVTTPGDRAGASAVVTVQVGAPLSGPDRKGGGRNEDADAPDHGAATGTRGAVAPGPASGAAAAPAPEAPEPEPREPAKARPAGEPVSGMLLTGAAVPPRPSEAVAARTGKLSEDGQASLPGGAALGLIVTAGLLGAGALIEMRG